MLHFTLMNKKILVVTSKKKRLKLTKRRICVLSAVVQVVSVKIMDNLFFFFLYQYLISNKEKKKKQKTCNQFFLIIFVQFKSGVIQLILGQIRRCIFKPFWTSLLKVGQRTFSSFEMIVNLEPLIPFIKSSQFSQERKVFFRILNAGL